MLHFVDGFVTLPTRDEVFEANLVDRVVFGQEGIEGTSLGSGEFEVTKTILTGGVIDYQFHYHHVFELERGEPPLHLEISDLGFRARDGEPLETVKLLGDAELTDQLFLEAQITDEKIAKAVIRKDHGAILTYSSCGHATLPVFENRVELDDGTRIEIDERFDPDLAVQADFSPASVTFAYVQMGGESQSVESYWDLVYSAEKHNEHREFWIVLDPPMMAPNIVEPVHVIEIVPVQPEDPIVVPGARYLDAKLDVIASLEIVGFGRDDVDEARFRRGDADASGAVELVDVHALLAYLFVEGERPSCLKAGDTNDDGELELTDALLIVLYLFRGMEPFPGPTDFCGRDQTPDALPCDLFAPCR